MTQGEKLKAAMEAAGTDEILLARIMKVSPGRMVAVTKGWTELEPWERITAEVLLRLERGSLKGEEGAPCHGAMKTTTCTKNGCSAPSSKERSTAS